MDHTPSSLAALLQRRLDLLQSLANELTEARPAFVGLKVDLVESHIFRQRSLCEQISGLNKQLIARRCSLRVGAEGVRAGTDSAGELDSIEGIAELSAQTKVVADEVRKLNRIHTHFLRRSSRNLKALSNLFASYSLTYEIPGQRLLHISVSDGLGA